MDYPLNSIPETISSLKLFISDDGEDVLCQDVCQRYMTVVAKENAEKKLSCGYQAARSLASL